MVILSENQVLENPRLFNKHQKLDQTNQLTKFYNHEPCTLSLKQIIEIRRAQLSSNFDDSLNQFTLYNFEEELERFRFKLSLCGHYVTTNYYCKQCESEGESESLLAFKKEIHTCGIRLCDKEDCIIQRFASTYESLAQIKRFENLKTLHHFVIGFPKISREDFENNFDKIKKSHEKVMNSFFRRLKKAGIKIEAYRVLDISKGKREKVWDNKYYIHYHFIAIPWKNSESRSNLAKIQLIRKQLIEKQREKIPFHFQSFGLKKKEAMYSYISIRSIGLYKKFETKERDYNINESKNLRESIKAGEFMKLKKIINEKQYLKYFFNHRHLNKIGDMPPFRYGPITADNIISVMCKKHGELWTDDRNKVRKEIIIDLKPPPPPNKRVLIEKNKIFLVHALEVQKINKETGYQPFSKHYINPISNIKIKNFEDIQPLTYSEDLQKRLDRFLDLKINKKIKLSNSDRINLAITGRC